MAVHIRGMDMIQVRFLALAQFTKNKKKGIIIYDFKRNSN